MLFELQPRQRNLNALPSPAETIRSTGVQCVALEVPSAPYDPEEDC